MFSIISERLRQKKRTVAFPQGEPTLPARFRGLPELDPARCAECALSCPPPCILACPSGALSQEGGVLSLDLGRCTFCGGCEAACPNGAVRFTRAWSLSARSREDLILRPRAGESALLPRMEALDARMQKLFGRSLKLRQVSAGGCNACEADTNVLTTVVFDLSRFGIDFVASPRHADGLYLTGPVPENMREGLLATLEALPSPRVIIAAGACAISGGLFSSLDTSARGAPPHLTPDLFIPGCPPHPITALDGMLRLLGRI